MGTAVVAAKVFCGMLANLCYLYSSGYLTGNPDCIGLSGGQRAASGDSSPCVDHDAVSCAISVLVTAILVLFSGPIFDFLTPDAAIAALGRQILRIELVLEIGRSINIVMVRCLVALGDVNFPVALGVVSMWGVSVLGAWFLGVHLGMGLSASGGDGRRTNGLRQSSS